MVRECSLAMAGLKQNVVANFLGQTWAAAMALVFVPTYIRYLGVEAYALIGLFTVMQAALSLLDMGMTATLTREMARFTAGAHTARSIRTLLRTFEIICFAVASVATIALWASSGYIGRTWLRAESIPPDVVANALGIMALVVGVRFCEGIYRGSLFGLQRQVWYNCVSATLATLRFGGAVVVLAWLSPTIHAFFVWQAATSLLSVVLLAACVYQALPGIPSRATFSREALLGIRRFAAGIMAITILGLLVTQADKVLLSRLLPLQMFGYYMLAATIAGALYMVVAPITQAIYPRLVELSTGANEEALVSVYHRASQLVTVVMGGFSVILLIFAEKILLLWTGDPILTDHVCVVMRVLALGTLLNGLMWIPYNLQLAHGWTALTVTINTIAVLILVPALICIAPIYGGVGAAWVWVTLNAGYLVFTIYFLHKRLLPKEKWHWYSQDVAIPLGAAVAAAALCHWAMPQRLGRVADFIFLLASSAVVLASAALAAPMVRRQLTEHVFRRAWSHG
jgi:O-antigen/teichoic acid export membrane protein